MREEIEITRLAKKYSFIRDTIVKIGDAFRKTPIDKIQRLKKVMLE